MERAVSMAIRNYDRNYGKLKLSQNESDSGTAGDEPNKFSDLKRVFVGGSQAYRMSAAAAANNMGLDIENLVVPGFRISDTPIENTVEQLRDGLEG
jgi:hypothetical protein